MNRSCDGLGGSADAVHRAHLPSDASDILIHQDRVRVVCGAGPGWYFEMYLENLAWMIYLLKVSILFPPSSNYLKVRRYKVTKGKSGRSVVQD